MRLAVNAANAALDAWQVRRAVSLPCVNDGHGGGARFHPLFHSLTPAQQAAVSNGKRAATALTNAALTQLHLPALSLGLLADISGLRPAAQAKLQQQQGAALAELAASTYQLREAAGGLAAASDSLRTLLDAETAAPLLAEAPVFATLPLHLLAGMFGEVAAMHDAELAVKAGVLAGFQQIVGKPVGCC